MFQVRTYNPFTRVWLRHRNYRSFRAASVAVRRFRNGEVTDMSAPSRPVAMVVKGVFHDLSLPRSVTR